MNKGVLISIIVVIILIAGGIYFATKSSPSTTTTSQQSPSSSNPTGVNTEKIQIKSFAFSPETLTIAVGTEVQWTNLDSAPHLLISDSGNEISSPQLSKSQTYTHTFNSKGTYSYHCSIHPSMKGTVIVQ